MTLVCVIVGSKPDGIKKHLPLATYVILQRMLSLLISLSPSGGLTKVWQIMATLILARTHRFVGWKKNKKRKCQQSPSYQAAL